MIGIVNRAVLRFTSGVPNLYFIKYPHILVNVMNFLQDAQYDYLSLIVSRHTGVMISPQPDKGGKKLQRQKILMFICPIYYHN